MKLIANKTLSIFALLLTVSFSVFAGAGDANTFNHSGWDAILKKNVSSEGNVNYKAIKSADKAALEKYLEALSSATVDEKSWSEDEQLAFWINAYNAFTVKLIVDNYPVKKITSLEKGKPWDKAFFSLNGKKMSLNDVEHKILRKKFNEPRIHFAIVCASFSCPKLLNEAYTGTKVQSQMEAQTKAFMNDKKRNKMHAKSPKISEIFSWFAEDFTKNGTLVDFINKYSDIQLNKKARISYLTYNWNLNE